MSEAVAEAQPTDPNPQGDPAGDEPLGEGGKKALEAERTRAKAAEKALSEAQARLKDIEAAQMSDLERAQSAAKEYQEAAAKATAEALRWRIASAHGITADDAETFLTGADEATLTRQAERLSALAATTPTTPKPDLSQGAKGTPSAATTGDKFAAQVSQLLDHS